MNKDWVISMIEAFDERARLCTCPFEAHQMKQEADNYREMLKIEEGEQK